MDLDIDKSSIDINVPYTLPVSTHSLGLTTRAITAWFGEQVKFVPDYGGVIEIPGSFIKNNGLRSGIPVQCDIKFKHRTHIAKNHGDLIPRLIDPPPSNCLVATRYLNCHNDRNFSTITALGSDLFINSIEFDEPKTCGDDIGKFDSKLYSHTHYSDDIINLKPVHDLKDYLILMYDKGIKIAQLNKLFLPCDNFDVSDVDEKGQMERSEIKRALDIKLSISESASINVKDSCLNHFNKSILGIATEQNSKHEVKFYDIGKSKSHYHKITWECNNSLSWPAKLPTSRARNTRAYASTKPTYDEIRHLDNVPNHLVNMMMLTNFSAVLIDPRLDRLAMDYIQKSKTYNFYPTERLYDMKFSQHNAYQFYCSSDTFVRVIDTRYPGTPVNQLNHMLDIDPGTKTNMIVTPIDFVEEGLETLFLSVPDRLCLMTFHQDASSSIVNPKSRHQPWHEHNNSGLLDQFDDLYGLAIINENNNTRIENSGQFNVVQTTNSGFLSIRRFNTKSEDDEIQEDGDITISDEIIWNTLNANLSSGDLEFDLVKPTKTRKTNTTQHKRQPVPNCLDILNDQYHQRLREGLTTTRAGDLYQKMVDKIDIIEQ